jgi:hypothetical protein
VQIVDHYGSFGMLEDLSQYGRDVEAEVQRQYRASFPGNLVEFGRNLYYNYPGGWWKPDIQDFTLSAYQEIKPLSIDGIGKGIVQMAAYDAAFQSPPFNMHRGGWVPRFATVGAYPVFFIQNSGIIFYTDDKHLAEILAVTALSSMEAMLRLNVIRFSGRFVSNLAPAAANILRMVLPGVARQMESVMVIQRF